ncbi:unnamed protein product [Psylliodes chrysocephalus]|uniref:Uncharacterized protein n=1 Tax=Psylliodes chrysocephalus TaxID=3402493 RepID=A0A9P0GF17_9CUCU|nr:unnamed protein product [Psylliodes chrysocephala]
MKLPITFLLLWMTYCSAHSRDPGKMLAVDRFRIDFFDLEKDLWNEVSSYVNNDVIKQPEIVENGPEVKLMKKFEKFGDMLYEEFPKDLTYGLDTLESVWILQLALGDLRAIYGLYETFRRFEKQQTAPNRIPSPKQAWLDLAKTILYDTNNVDESMKKIQETIDKDKLFESAKKEVEGDMLCNSKQSPQQVLYNLYNAIALTELKGYSMIQFSYMLLRLYNKGNFTTESQIMRQRFEERTNSAMEIVKKSMADASRQYWNCDPKRHIKGETYEEITQLLQGYVQNEVDLNPEGTCRENCAEYAYTKSHGCFGNQYCRQQRRCNGKILDCRYFDSDMWICPADPLSGRRYEYIEYENGRVLGRKQSCQHGTNKVDSWWRWLFWHCSYCFCLCDEQSSNSDRYVNMRPAISNLSSNMVVTGLRFVKKNRIIHIQIQEGKLLPRGNIDASTVRWVPVEDYKITDRKIYNGQDYHTFSWEKRAVDLDDLEADEGHVLTGVRFKEIGSHLNFEIFVTKFDFDSGKLINPTSTSVWKDNSNTDSSTTNPRKKVWLVTPDIPTRTTSPSIPTSKSDEYIELVNSDIDRDAAQTTVPFLDAQKLESLQPVPLSGAGIFHKGRKYFGGFITLKVMTYDYSRHIRAALSDEEVETN